jgi:soluble lytic murein transglycosylase-like protein
MEPEGLDMNLATDLLVEAVVQIESQGNPRMVGGVGERGLMQIRGSTWEEVTRRHFGEAIPFDRAFEPELNRRVGRLYLGDLQVFLLRHRNEWQSDLRSLLLASYNAGPDRVRRSGFNLRALPPQVQSYVNRGCALHDWYLEEQAPEMRKRLETVPQP